MRETELEPGYVWGGAEAGKARDSKDTLEGIWVKVYAGDLLVLEDARPKSLMRKEGLVENFNRLLGLYGKRRTNPSGRPRQCSPHNDPPKLLTVSSRQSQTRLKLFRF